MFLMPVGNRIIEFDPVFFVVAFHIKKKTGLNTLKRSTDEAVEKMENAKIRCWNKTRRKNEMETGAQNSNITEREMVEESCRMEP